VRTALVLALLAVAPPAQAFDPIAFFTGRSAGEGAIKVLFQVPKPLAVQSFGTRQKDGSLLLRQVIREAGEAPRTRYWRLRRVTAQGFEGTLTDAVGPVRIEREGNAIRIRYKGTNKLDFDQRLTPAGPRAITNRMQVKRFGITVATVDERIRKLD
jgi:hypothetical protein